MRKSTLIILGCAAFTAAGVWPVLAANYESTVLMDQPAGYWRLGDNAPAPQPVYGANLGTLGDAAQGEYLGNPTLGQPGGLAGSTDTAGRFIANQRLQVPYTVEINPNPPFSVEGWVKPASLQTGTGVVSPMASLRRASPAAEGWIFYQTATGWNYRQGDSANNYTININTTNNLDTNTWYHLVAVYDGAKATVYVNGAEAGTGSSSLFAPNSSVPLGIGARGDATFGFDGSVDEVAVYNLALSGSQVSAHYSNGTNSARTTPYEQVILALKPLGYWRLNEPAIPPLPTAKNIGSLADAADGTYLGAQGGQTGAIQADSNTAAAFNGTGNKVDVPFNSGLNTPKFTMECWAKVTPGSANHRSPMTSRDDAPQRGYIIYATPANQWEFWTGTGAGWLSLTGPAVVEDQWTHLVATYDGSYKRFYVDGVLSVMDAAPTVLALNTARPLRIGGGATEGTGNYFFAGEVDEAAVYTNALAPDRVLAHYLAGSGTKPVPVAPVIVREAQNQTNYINQPVSLAVAATGSLPLNYQWKFKGTAIKDATNDTFSIASARLTDAGTYTVEVSNEGGTVASAEAVVEILNISVPTFDVTPQPATVYAGGTANFTAKAAGSVLMQYQWQFNGANLAHATNATLAVADAQTVNQGDYRVVATNPAGSATSQVARLTVIVLPANSYASFIMADKPISYWRLGETSGEVALDYAGGRNGAYLNGVSLGQPGALVGDNNTAAGFNGDAQTKLEIPYNAALNPTNFSLELWAKITGGSAHRSPVTSRDDAPQRGYIIYATPANQWEFWSGTGAGWDTIAGPAVVNDKWIHLAITYDGVTKRFYTDGALAGSSTNAFRPNTARPLRIGAGATETETGNFFFFGDIDEVAFYNTVLTPEKIALHFGAGFGATTPPTINTQPASRAVLPGANVTFKVQAAGSLPLKYRWQFNGTDLVGQTNNSLSLSNVTSAEAGSYRVIVNNLAGTTTSDAATLKVITVSNLPYLEVVKADAPVGYWRLGETSGETAADVMGKNNGSYLNGVELGVPGALTGDANNAAGFSAANQSKVEVPYTAELNPPVFSLEVWAKVTGGAGAHRSPLASRDDAPQRGYIFYAEPGNTWQFWTGTGASSGWDVIAGPALTIGAWAHLVATYDGTTKRFYVNGAEVGTSTNPFGVNDAQLLRIGGSATENPVGSFFFEGSIDEVAVYDKPLSPESILTHYAAGARPVTAPPTISVARAATGLTLTWTGKLQEADEAAGAWRDVSGAASPWSIALPGTSTRKFYRAAR